MSARGGDVKIHIVNGVADLIGVAIIFASHLGE